ncbi:putative aminopeptidase-2 [Epargyreus clarus]|uniref:putative aminopeptidase-2 n=1 Tax=Epargyreus clarus TaxID=520877 RepID=UPI003C2F7235
MSLLLKLLLLPVLLAVVKAEFPFDLDELIERTSDVGEEFYRIPEDLDPINYDVEITPYFEATTTREAFTFDGIVTITLRAVKAGITSLIIQENVREILSVTLTDTAGVPIALNGSNPFERLRDFHFLKINLRDGVTLTNSQVYRLTVVYLGNINETPLSRGVFRGSYRDDNGKLHWYAATHLQPTHSRQAFPSFDEPGFKSTFNIIINRPAHFTETFSNMRIKESTLIGDRVREVFHTTPRMSAYLVTFHISEEFKVIADNNDRNNSYRILARPNAQGQGEYALEVGPPLTKWLEEYLGIDYYSMGEDMKNDQIASPDWASGATENWGLVTYREVRLLYQDGETSNFDKKYIATITAHELAHKWFGNLVTCRWWDNVWINEGFASYFEYFAMDEVDKSMELEDQFNVFYLQSALSVDASISTRALQHTVNSPAQVTGHFTGISYSKGAAFLLMLKHYVTESTFKKALHYFLVDRAYEHAFPVDLFNNFARAVREDQTLPSGVDIAAMMRYWVEEPGYPLITVNVNMATGVMSISQERFFVNPTNPTNQVWSVPLTYTTGSNPNWNDLRSTNLMTGRTMEITKSPGHEWVIFNVQQKGIYRVNYDTHNWEMLASALKRNRTSIHRMNRAQIVDDVFALMRAEKITFDLGFQVLDFLKEETNFFVWYPAISGFTWLRNRFLHLPATLEQFDTILKEFLTAVIREVGYNVAANEPLTTTLNRFFILTFACNIGHDGCVNDAVIKFRNLRTNGVAVNPNLRRHVFCEGLRHGGFEEWQFLYQRRMNSNNQADQVAMLRALGCTTTERAVTAYLEMVLSDDVKAQDSVNAMTFLYMGDRANAKVALQYIKPRVEQFRRKVVLPAWWENILINLASYLDEEGLQDMQQWLNTNQASIPSFQTGLNAITSSRNSMQWGTDRADRILRAARGSAPALVPTFTLLNIKKNFEMLLKLLRLAVLAIAIQTVRGDTNYRLNTTITPIAYALSITPYFDTGNENAFTFDGEVTIRFTTDKNINQIKLHSEDLTFTAESIKVTTGTNVISLVATNPLEFDEKYSFAHINLQTELQTGIEYNLNIVYKGPIRQDLNGFYRNYYIEKGVKKWLGATQFESTNARKAFPCFDEPSLKAVFTLTIDRPEHYQPSLTNTKMQSSVPLSNGYVREVFHPTPRMSTYLVAFLISEFEAANITDGAEEFGVYTRPEAKNQSDFAFDFGKRVVQALGDYFGINYYSVDSNLRLDHVALIDFRAGAMENWGLIKYREALLLYAPEHSNPYYKYRIAQILAHETTHMWFGNLVTCHWWSNTWLNEGFANYFQDYITSLVEPEVGSADILVTGSVYSAYDADDNPDSPPISNDNVNSPAEISGHFGTVTYQKAGSVIRMMHHLLGDDAFKLGLHTYLETNKLQPGYPERLYEGLQTGVTAYPNSLSLYPETDITTVMSSWITQSGHPIVHVTVNRDDFTVSLTQKRFYIDPTHKSDQLYKIPITYTYGNAPSFTNTKPAFIMHDKTHTFNITKTNESLSWVIVNLQETGLYRVNYDSESWKLISTELKGSKREDIHNLNRAKEFALQLMENIINKLGYEVRSTDSLITEWNRMQIMQFACKLGHQGCMENMLALYKDFRQNGKEIAPSLRSAAYCTGLRHGNGSDYDFLWDRMATTNVANEARIIGDIMGCSADESKLRSYLTSMLVENSPIKTQDLTVPLASVLSNYSHVHIVIEELDKNVTLWKSIYTNLDSVLPTIASALHTEKEFNDFEAWLSSCTECGEQAVTAAKGTLAKQRAATTWAENHKADIVKSLKNSAVKSASSAILVFTALLAMLIGL